TATQRAGTSRERGAIAHPQRQPRGESASAHTRTRKTQRRSIRVVDTPLKRSRRGKTTYREGTARHCWTNDDSLEHENAAVIAEDKTDCSRTYVRAGSHSGTSR